MYKCKYSLFMILFWGVISIAFCYRCLLLISASRHLEIHLGLLSLWLYRTTDTEKHSLTRAGGRPLLHWHLLRLIRCRTRRDYSLHTPPGSWRAPPTKTKTHTRLSWLPTHTSHTNVTSIRNSLVCQCILQSFSQSGRGTTATRE